MPDCNYCSQEFESEDNLLQHYASKHDEVLSRIDKRRVENSEYKFELSDDDELTQEELIQVIVITIGILVFLALTYFLVL